MVPLPHPELVQVPAGIAHIGSAMDEVDACVESWGRRLVDPSYSIESFRSWILKEHPRHEKPIEAFWLGKYPVSNREYRAFIAGTGAAAPESIATGEPDEHPVWGVTRADARAYAAWLTALTGRRYRLPTEYEWEYAARGPSVRAYPFGNDFDPRLCNTSESGIGHTTPVDAHSRGASELGACDLAGNVEEWTDSDYAPYPGGRFIEDDLSRAFQGPYPILRGGSFARGGDLARCARRHGPYPAPEFRFVGFRIAAGNPPPSRRLP